MLAKELVGQGVSMILASGGDNSIKAAIAATKTLPIVFATADDPVAAGYVKSLNRPGGNMTGITFLGSALEPKRLEVLHQIAPKVNAVAVFMGTANARTERDARDIEAAAKSLGLRVRFVNISNEDDFAPTFRDVVARRDDAIHFVTDPFFVARARTLAALAATANLPATSNERSFADAGGLLSYGASAAPSRNLYWPGPQGREAGGAAGAGVDEDRTGHQSESRQGAGAYCPAAVARPRRRGDRIAVFLLRCTLSAIGRYC